MRLTAANSSGTDTIPASASGSFSVVEEKPSSFTLAPAARGRPAACRSTRCRRARTRRRRSCARTGPCCGRPRRRTDPARRLPRCHQAQHRRAERDQREHRPFERARPRALMRRERSSRSTLDGSGDGERRTARSQAGGVPWAAGVYALPRNRSGDLEPRRHARGGHLPVVRGRRDEAADVDAQAHWPQRRAPTADAAGPRRPTRAARRVHRGVRSERRRRGAAWQCVDASAHASKLLQLKAPAGGRWSV